MFLNLVLTFLLLYMSRSLSDPQDLLGASLRVICDGPFCLLGPSVTFWVETTERYLLKVGLRIYRRHGESTCGT